MANEEVSFEITANTKDATKAIMALSRTINKGLAVQSDDQAIKAQQKEFKTLKKEVDAVIASKKELYSYSANEAKLAKKRAELETARTTKATAQAEVDKLNSKETLTPDEVNRRSREEATVLAQREKEKKLIAEIAALTNKQNSLDEYSRKSLAQIVNQKDKEGRIRGDMLISERATLGLAMREEAEALKTNNAIENNVDAQDDLTESIKETNSAYEAQSKAAEGATDTSTTTKKANTASADPAVATKQENESLKELLVTLSAYKTSLEAANSAGRDTANIEQQIANTTDKINQKFDVTSATKNIAELIRRYNELNEAKKSIEGLGMPKELDSEYATTLKLLATLSTQIKEYKRNLDGTARSNKKAERAGVAFARNVTNAFKGLGKLVDTVKRGFSNLHKSSDRVKKSIDGIGRSAKSNFKHMLSNITKYVFGFRSLFFLIRRLRKYLGEGIQDLVRYEKAIGKSKMFGSVNQSITQLRTSLLYLEHAWAAAFAPIITAVTPILTALIDKLAVVGNAIARFIGGLTGAKVVYNAIKVPADDYADSLDKAAGSAGAAAKKQKELNDRLAAFDDLIVLGKDKDPNKTGTGGGGGAADQDATDYSKLFKIVGPDEGGLIDMLKKAWETADFTEVGNLFRDKLVEALSNIKWENIKAKAGNLGKAIGTFLVGMFGDKQLWEAVGETFGEGLNTASEGISKFLDSISGADFGGSAASGLNKFFFTRDWKKAGQNINKAFTTVTKNIQSFLDTLNSDTLSTAISDFIGSMDLLDLSKKAGVTVIKLGKAIIEVTSETVKKLGEDLGEKLNIYVSSKNITFVDDAEGNKIPIELVPTYNKEENPIKALVDRWLTDLGQVVVQVGFGITGLDDTVQTANKFFGTITKINSTLQTALQIIGALQLNLGDLFALFSKIGGGDGSKFLGVDLSKFSLLFSTVSAGLGNIRGVFDALIPRMEKAKKFGEDLSAIMVGAKALWDENGFAGLGQAMVEGIAEGIGNAFVNAVDWVEKHLAGPIIDGFKTCFSIHSPSKVTEEWGVNLIEGLLNGINSLIDTVMEPFNSLYNNLSTKWSEIKGNAWAKWEGIRDMIVSKALEVKDNALLKFDELKEGVARVWSNIAGVAYAKWDNIKTVLVNAVNSIKSALREPVNGVISVFENMTNKIISGIKSLVSKLNIPDIKIGDKTFSIKASVANLQPVKFGRVPKLAQGAVIPPNREFMAVLGDQSHGTNVEAPLDTIKQAVAEVLANNGNEEVIQLLRQLIGVVESKNLTIGDKEIAKANARYTNQQRFIRGASF